MFNWSCICWKKEKTITCKFASHQLCVIVNVKVNKVLHQSTVWVDTITCCVINSLVTDGVDLFCNSSSAGFKRKQAQNTKRRLSAGSSGTEKEPRGGRDWVICRYSCFVFFSSYYNLNTHTVSTWSSLDCEGRRPDWPLTMLIKVRPLNKSSLWRHKERHTQRLHQITQSYSHNF